MVLKWARAPMAHPLSSNSAAGFRKFRVAEHRKARRKLHAQLRNSTVLSGANPSMGHAHVSFKRAPHDALRDALHDTLPYVMLCSALQGFTRCFMLCFTRHLDIAQSAARSVV